MVQIGQEDVDSPHVVIIGAGLGGLACAIALKRQLGFNNFTIYEKAGDVGGTWWNNTYPGCGCDTPTHWYSLSSDLNPNWSTVTAPQPEVLAYWQDLAVKYGLYGRTVFHTRVLSAVWSAERQEYDVDTEDVRTGERARTRARAVVSAVGYLVEPKIPQEFIEKGLGRFKGPALHSAEWDHSIDWSGKKVAVIGNSASAAQFIPRLIADPTTHVVNFCRTPNWFLPGIQNGEYSTWQKWMFANVPFTLRLYRNWLVTLQAIVPILRTYWRRLNGTTRPEETLARYIKETAPQRYHDKLVPDYPVACRRPILDPGYLACLHKPNVELVWDSIRDISDTEITTEKGDTFSADAIILSTGFVTDRCPVNVIGRTGETLEGYFSHQGGPSAYHGVTVPGFPNFFFVGGPNTVTSLGSAVFTHEIAIDYMMQLLRPLVEPSPTRLIALSVQPPAHDAYNSHLQDRMGATTYVSCASWYRAGADGRGKNFGIFPGSLLSFWWLMRKVRWEDYLLERSCS